VGIGQKIRQLRLRHNFSMRSLGDKLGVSHAHISKIESGESALSIELLEKIANLFKVKITFFFEEDVEDPELTLNQLGDFDSETLMFINKIRLLDKEQFKLVESIVNQFIKN
jgi:transcriptional regulator with XRE-family HTH domain